MKIRPLAILLAATGVIASLSTPVADGAVGPLPLQALAELQTNQLLSRYHDGDTASPASCERAHARLGVFLLPTLSFASGDDDFTCRTSARHVLIDLGGIVATEDNRGDTYTTTDGDVLLFTRANLEAICDDVLLTYPPAAAPATVDGESISGAKVSTPSFTARVNRHAGLYWQDSVDLGHPGHLAASFCGWKAVVALAPGRHVIAVDLTDTAGAPTHFVYHIKVRGRHCRQDDGAGHPR